MENKKRNLIDRDDLIDSLGISDMDIYAKECISEAPTVDAVEVVHGHWNVLHFMTEPWQLSLPDKYVCSECKIITYSKHNYCPNCGAKMDGGKHE